MSVLSFGFVVYDAGIQVINFANGMIFHFFKAGSLQNTASYKGQVGYNLSKLGLKDTWIGYRYTFFDLDTEYSKNQNGLSQDGMQLNGVRISYGGDFGSLDLKIVS